MKYAAVALIDFCGDAFGTMKPYACDGPKKSPMFEGRPFGRLPHVVAKTSDAAMSTSCTPASVCGIVQVVSPDGGNMKPEPVTGFEFGIVASATSVRMALTAVHEPVP